MISVNYQRMAPTELFAVLWESVTQLNKGYCNKTFIFK